MMTTAPGVREYGKIRSTGTGPEALTDSVNLAYRTLTVALCCGLVAAPAAYGQAEPEDASAQPIEPAEQPAASPGDTESEPDAAESPGPADGSAEPASDARNSLELRFVMEDLLASGDLEAAEALADLLLELSEADFGSDSAELAEAHLLISEIQKRQGDYTEAETNILSAIDIYESRRGPFTPELIDPFMDLGDNYEEAGDYVSAISAYGEARTIGRRNYGLLNEDQLAIIDTMTEAAEQLGQLEEAMELQLEALMLIERNYEETSLEAINARYKFAAWLEEHRQYEEARRYYFEIHRIISREYDDDPIMVARVHRARAKSYRDQDNGDGLGLSGLRDALEMVKAMPDPPALLVAELYLDAGDWNVEFSRSGAIGDDYIEAWNWLGRVENGGELRREWFEELTVVEIDPISMRGLSNDPESPLGFVEIAFTIDSGGRARDIEILNSYPVGFKDGAFLRQYREARFRPFVRNGEFIEVRRARRNEFRFDPAAVE